MSANAPGGVEGHALLPANGNLLNFIAFTFRLLPKNLMSYITGWIARLELPQPLSRWMLGTFAAKFRLDLSEAELPLSAYPSVEALFTRKLRPGARPLSSPVASPSDGYLARSEPATSGQAVQAKGLTYSLSELVRGPGNEAAAPGVAVDLAWYQTVYLAPHNYHRVHAPVGGAVTAVRYIPGELWPVALPFVARVPRLFIRNERLVFDVALEGGGIVHIVMVGAFNVGRMVTPLAPDLVTNDRPLSGQPRPRVQPLTPPRPLALGDEIGTFMLGSTVILAYDRVAASRFPLLQTLQTGETRPILMGQSLCLDGKARPA
jgi:phosphatidylserine decarboxylase